MKFLACLSTIAAIVAALPAPADDNPSNTLAPRAVCTPTAGGSSSTDDVPAIASALSTCGKGGTIVFPAGVTYYANSVLDLSACASCDIQLEGLLKFSSSTSYWSGRTAMILLEDASGVKVRSLTGGGVIDGNGQDAWDLFASDSSYARPTLLYITGGSDIDVSGLRQKNPPNVFVSVKGGAERVAFSSLKLDATSKSDNPPKNTDGFDIGESTGVTLYDIDVSNDDDCVAFKPGANYVTIDQITCTGSHGISVGSLGKSSDDTVKNVYASNVKMVDSTKAAGIKTYPSGGSHGLSTVSNVTFTGFTVQNCDYAFQVQSCYGEDADYCQTSPGNAQISGVVVKDFSGETSDKYDPTTANINCGAGGTCGITISDWTVKAPSGENQILCSNTPSALGVTCASGASG
ncbi:endo-xylogalacturonan hydrolase a [Diplodia corticola]|uniref:Endo-xylogalacturonan hydrolase a n=1 Tax=Diplodia corticola TaxID=236234 RepID=A0A1J9R4E2_9PEZI|nr:endo-xylogalacturonan hydrolase a [Diplodia corticola]OJD35449.1 endo-xylogalacturonan hydrolase a [Diplodia corticola]